MKKYQIIYADPPWKYRSTTSPGQIGKYATTKARTYYDVMSLEDICNMPIKEIADDNCVLFLWATFPLLPDCLKVFNAWGFKYKTLGFSWLKTNKKNNRLFFGVGNYTKSNAEVCLMGMRGKLKPVSNKVSSAILSPREKHSKKPSIVRKRIVELFGNLPRIELFARKPDTLFDKDYWKGWDVWGNEVESDIEL